MPISVIIPAYNAAAFIAEAIRSVRANGHEHEIIVVDDGSTDRTVDCIKEFPVRYVYQENAGASAARNRGIKLATHEWIAFCDADDVWPVDRLQKQFKKIRINPAVDIWLGKTLMQKENEPDQIVASFFFSSALIRRKVFDEVGWLDASFKSSEDVDWFLRAMEKGKTIECISDVTHIYRVRPGSLSYNKGLSEVQFLRAVKKSLERRRLSGEKNLPKIPGWELPLVSVIIPVYNGEQFLVEAIESALMQDYPNVEMIAVDDGSTDRSADILKQYEKIRTIRQANSGVACARNAGLRAARGEWVAFLDQDDLWTPFKLTSQIRFAGSHPEYDMIIGQQTTFCQSGITQPAWARAEWFEGAIPALTPSGWLVRKSAFQKYGFFDETLRNNSDVEWHIRGLDQGLTIGSVDAVVMKKRIHHHNESRHVTLSQNEVLGLLRQSVLRKRNSKK